MTTCKYNGYNIKLSHNVDEVVNDPQYVPLLSLIYNPYFFNFYLCSYKLEFPTPDDSDDRPGPPLI